MNKLLISLIIVSNIAPSCPSYGDTSIPVPTQPAVTFLPKGTPAPYEGFLFSKDKTLEMRKDLLDLDNDRLIITSYEVSVSNLKAQNNLRSNEIDVLLKQNASLIDQSASNNTKTFLENALAFGLGLLVMYGAVRVGQAATK
jgi:hypothetical protein